MSKLIPNIARFFGTLVMFVGLSAILLTSFVVGYIKGYGFGWNKATTQLQKFLDDKVSSTSSAPSGNTKFVPKTNAPIPTKSPSWGGPQLWEAVNKRRVQLGVNPLGVKDEVCTIASIRLNQLLDLGKLDGHVGFSDMPTARPDLKWIFEKYNLSEFLVSGATSPQNAVDLWENTLGHRELLSGGQYVWGCIYAQNGIGVAIAAY